MHLWKPLLADVLERCWGCYREAYEEDIRLGVRQGSQAIVVFLSRGIEKAESVGFVTDPSSVSSGSPVSHSSEQSLSKIVGRVD